MHLQYLGFPIANDPLYSTSTIWGPDRGAGGLALPRVEPSDRSATPANDAVYYDSLESVEARMRGEEALPPAAVRPKVKFQGKTERELAKLRERMKESFGLEEDGMTRKGEVVARAEEPEVEASGSGTQSPVPADLMPETSTAAASHHTLDAGLPLGNGEDTTEDGAGNTPPQLSAKLKRKAGRKQEKAERLERLLAKQTLPREDEDDRLVGGSPIFLSDQAREIIAKLRRQKVGIGARVDVGG